MSLVISFQLVKYIFPPQATEYKFHNISVVANCVPTGEKTLVVHFVKKKEQMKQVVQGNVGDQLTRPLERSFKTLGDHFHLTGSWKMTYMVIELLTNGKKFMDRR